MTQSSNTPRDTDQAQDIETAYQHELRQTAAQLLQHLVCHYHSTQLCCLPCCASRLPASHSVSNSKPVRDNRGGGNIWPVWVKHWCWNSSPDWGLPRKGCSVQSIFKIAGREHNCIQQNLSTLSGTPPRTVGIKKPAQGGFFRFGLYYFLKAPKRLLKRSIRPPVSTTFCLPV